MLPSQRKNQTAKAIVSWVPRSDVNLRKVIKTDQTLRIGPTKEVDICCIGWSLDKRRQLREVGGRSRHSALRRAGKLRFPIRRGRTLRLFLSQAPKRFPF